MAHTRKNISKGISPDTKPKEKPDSGKGKSGGDPHGRTIKEKVTDFAKGVGLTSGQKKAREFAKGGLLLASGVAGNLAARAANIVKKAHAHKKE